MSLEQTKIQIMAASFPGEWSWQSLVEGPSSEGNIWWFIFSAWLNVESFKEEVFGHACENIQIEFIEMGGYIATVDRPSGKLGSWTEWRGERELSTQVFASWNSPLQTLSQLWENKPFFSLAFFTLGILLHFNNKAIKESFWVNVYCHCLENINMFEQGAL